MGFGVLDQSLIQGVEALGERRGKREEKRLTVMMDKSILKGPNQLYCCFQCSCNSSRASFFCSKCLNFCASDYSLNSQYFSMIFVAMYLYDYYLDAGTWIIKTFLVLTKLENWPSLNVIWKLLPQSLLFWLQTKEKYSPNYSTGAHINFVARQWLWWV